MEIIIIAAVAANGVIGRDSTLPWHLPEDLAHFKETTMGHPVIMGRINFEDVLAGLGSPLPGRTNIVMTRSEPEFPKEVLTARSIEEALAAAEETGTDQVYIAGGASIYEQFLPYADRMLLTELHDSYDGDVYFPQWDQDCWERIAVESFSNRDIVEYRRLGC